MTGETVILNHVALTKKGPNMLPIEIEKFGRLKKDKIKQIPFVSVQLVCVYTCLLTANLFRFQALSCLSVFLSVFKESAIRPILSNSCNVHIFVPSQCNFF